MKTDASTGLYKGGTGLGPTIQQSPSFEKGLHQPTEASLVGLNNSSADGDVSSVSGLDLKEVEVSQSFGGADLGPALPFFFGVDKSKVPSSSSGRTTRRKDGKEAPTHNGPKFKKTGKENNSVLGKRREQSGTQSAIGAESESVESHGGEKRLALCDINSYIHPGWIQLLQDGLILRTDYYSSCIRLLMLLMGSKLEGQIPLVHWGNCLTMVIVLAYTVPPFSIYHVTMANVSPSCFAHGFVSQFEALAFGNTAMCGGLTFWYWVISAVPFYLATWEHYFTNTLILPAVNGPTEGLMLIYLVHFFTAIVGSEWWVQPFGKSLPFLSWIPVISEIPTNKVMLFLMVVFAVIPTIACNVQNVYKVVQARKGNMLLALAMVNLDYLSPEDIIRNYPHLVIIGTGLAFGFLVGRLILSHLCDEPKGLKTSMCMSLLFLPFGIANALTARLNDGVPLVDERWVLLLYCAYTAALYLHFATSVIHEITTALGIYCFSHIALDQSMMAKKDSSQPVGKSEAMDQIHGLSIVKILAEYGLHRFWILS
ncbi:hypothetical protein RHGRI_033715 [Rhododendron griersonianum]|uniref:Uncharacterized protein n=1 Tax=Rhododendron griersonianum TaxID=479676 RepID=A0AAV6I3J8_9ERIC|nr:hypothetical protein RHGRI_033715 [Rhododendron griersonianum]